MRAKRNSCANKLFSAPVVYNICRINIYCISNWIWKHIINIIIIIFIRSLQANYITHIRCSICQTVNSLHISTSLKIQTVSNRANCSHTPSANRNICPFNILGW
ncbi:MAG: hypothetical protein IIW92_05400 [Lachnospiraceae bacterium]|nr:hypothetical protein [Lachnospiraceae bacterium]